MSTLQELDKNFAVEAVNHEGMVAYDAKKPPFRIYGFYQPEAEGPFRRLPAEVAEAASRGVAELCKNTAGGRVRFATDSSKFILTYRLSGLSKSGRMSVAASSSFDIYADGVYHGCILAEEVKEGVCEATTDFYAPHKMRQIEICFPLYVSVEGLILSIEEGCSVAPAKEYSNDLPVVVYGSSITQGGCASHPGNAYPAMLSRTFDIDVINLGFSGNGRGEQSVAEYLADLPMAALIIDYDHNSYDIEELRARHQPFFKTFRKKQPHTPVLFISVADRTFGDATPLRRDIIYKTYQDAKDEGDTNVYFLDGQTIYDEKYRNLCTVDCVHATDIGFFFFAEKITPILKEMLEKKGGAQ